MSIVKQTTILSACLLISACSSAVQAPAPIVSQTPYNSINQPVVISRPINNQEPISTPIYTVEQIQSKPIQNNQVVQNQEVLVDQQDLLKNLSFELAANTQDQQIPEFYTVQPGENLFRIATKYGLNYQEIAKLNNINPDTLSAGQVIRLRQANTATIIDSPTAIKTPINKEQSTSQINLQSTEQSTQQSAKQISQAQENIKASKTAKWPQPTQGQIIQRFSPPTNIGITYTGVENQPIRAVNDGKVVYIGNNTIRGYGNIIIIQDNQGITTVYGHNKEIQVKLNESVKTNQQIATMGIDPETNRPTLKFEVRKGGSAVDPLTYLVQ